MHRAFLASGDVLLVTDRTLGTFDTLDVGTISPVGIFSAWVQPVPEPRFLTTLGAVGLAGCAWRRRRRAVR